MSRLKNFARGVVSGYVQMAVSVLYALASVPLALHYLSKAEFALWALVSQVLGYLALIDLGMGVSVGRILADHKDNRDGGSYGAVLKSGQVVFTIQGALLGTASIVLAPFIADAFQIEAAMRADFILLIRAQGLVLAFLFTTKMTFAPFWSHQRYDIFNYASSAGLILSFAVLAWGLVSGLGLKSTILAQVADALLRSIWGFIACLRLGMFPRRGAWGRMDGKTLCELLHYGRDIFLMALGVQLLSASQVIIITRTLGLEAATTWAVCSKTFTLAQQAVSRILENSAGALTEMVVRGERDRLYSRFRDIVTLTASLSVAVSTIVAAVNGSFVAVWTRGRVSWPLAADVLMALYVAVFCISRSHTGLVGLTKEIRGLRFIHFFEGITFFAIAWAVTGHWAFPGLAAASVFAITLWSGGYGFVRSREYFGCSVQEFFTWLQPAACIAGVLVPTAIVAHWATRNLPPEWRLGVLASTLCLAAAALFVTVGLPKGLREEIVQRVRLRRLRSG
jgi:hypothetical protein